MRKHFSPKKLDIGSKNNRLLALLVVILIVSVGLLVVNLNSDKVEAVSQDELRIVDKNKQVENLVNKKNDSLFFRVLNYVSGQNSTEEKINKDLKAALKDRKDFLTDIIETDPGLVLTYQLSQSVIDNIPEGSLDLIERNRELKGSLNVLVADLKNGHHDAYYEFVEENTNEEYDLYFAEKPDVITPSFESKIQGVEIDGKIALESKGESVESLSVPGLDINGPQTTAVILINFLNDTSEPFTNLEAENIVFNNAGSTNAYYQENSFNAVSFTGDAYGWYTIPSNNTGCAYGTWASQANTAATNAGVNLGAYARKAYVFPDAPSCPWAGLAYLPGSTSWYSGYNDARLYAHELGHNIGMHHASSKDCGALSIDIYSNCTNSEYGDVFDPMGSWNLYHNSGIHKNAMGWIPDARVQTITENGTYTVYPIETSTANYQVLKITKTDTNEDYYIDYRQPIGFDSTLGVGVTGGVNIRIWKGLYWQTFLLDMTTGNGWSDVALTDGASFTDSINGLTITQNSHNGTSATITVSGFPTHTVTSSAGANGSISPNGATVVNEGSNQTFTITSDNGYIVDDVLVDGSSVGAVTSYEFTNVVADHTISATFVNAPVDHFTSDISGNKAAGVSFNVQVTAHDYLGVKTDYVGITNFTSSDGSATLPTDDGIGWVNGQKTFNFTLQTSGSQTITATDNDTGTYTDLNVTVDPDSLDHVVISPSVDQYVKGGESVQFTANGQDQYNNNITGLAYTWQGTDSGGLIDGNTDGVFQVKATTGGLDSPQVQVTVDSVDPSLSTPGYLSGDYIAGAKKMTATTSDNVGLKNVKYYIDNVLKETDTSGPYEYNLDTYQFSNGLHIYKVVSEDLSGNTRTNMVLLYFSNFEYYVLNPGDSISPGGSAEEDVTVKDGEKIFDSQVPDDLKAEILDGAGSKADGENLNPGEYTLKLTNVSDKEVTIGEADDSEEKEVGFWGKVGNFFVNLFDSIKSFFTNIF